MSQRNTSGAAVCSARYCTTSGGPEVPTSDVARQLALSSGMHTPGPRGLLYGSIRFLYKIMYCVIRRFLIFEEVHWVDYAVF